MIMCNVFSTCSTTVVKVPYLKEFWIGKNVISTIKMVFSIMRYIWQRVIKNIMYLGLKIIIYNVFKISDFLSMYKMEHTSRGEWRDQTNFLAYILSMTFGAKFPICKCNSEMINNFKCSRMRNNWKPILGYVTYVVCEIHGTLNIRQVCTYRFTVKILWINDLHNHFFFSLFPILSTCQ